LRSQPGNQIFVDKDPAFAGFRARYFAGAGFGLQGDRVQLDELGGLVEV